MFTGIIEAVGTVVQVQPHGGDLRLCIETGALPLDDVALGDSIATNGVCLTVTELTGRGYWADVSAETLQHTTVGQWQPGYAVNLEKALTPRTRLGGHIVSGHVDAKGEVLKRWGDARSERFRLRAPAELARYISRKGSITVDGISLTVNQVDGAEFELNIVPHTLKCTTMDSYRPGTEVNLEVDLLARYLERLLLGEHAAEPGADSGISLDFLTRHGFNQA